MAIQPIIDAARGLFSICVAVAALEQLAGDGRTARPFRALCALAATLCALRMAARLL